MITRKDKLKKTIKGILVPSSIMGNEREREKSRRKWRKMLYIAFESKAHRSKDLQRTVNNSKARHTECPLTLLNWHTKQLLLLHPQTIPCTVTERLASRNQIAGHIFRQLTKDECGHQHRHIANNRLERIQVQRIVRIQHKNEKRQFSGTEDHLVEQDRAQVLISVFC